PLPADDEEVEGQAQHPVGQERDEQRARAEGDDTPHEPAQDRAERLPEGLANVEDGRGERLDEDGVPVPYLVAQSALYEPPEAELPARVKSQVGKSVAHEGERAVARGSVQ